MSAGTADDGGASGEESGRGKRYADIAIDEDAFVVYDRENHQAWLQSTVAVDVESLE